MPGRSPVFNTQDKKDLYILLTRDLATDELKQIIRDRIIGMTNTSVRAELATIDPSRSECYEESEEEVPFTEPSPSGTHHESFDNDDLKGKKGSKPKCNSVAKVTFIFGKSQTKKSVCMSFTLLITMLS